MLRLADQTTRAEVLNFLATSSGYGNLGLFIGAGFSKAVLYDEVGGVALSWAELLHRTAKRMGVDYESIDKTGRSYPEIASTICSIYSKEKDCSFADSLRQLKTCIAELTSWYPTQEHRNKYSGFLEELGPAWIITTNYDLVIESLLTGKSTPLGPNDSLSSPKGVVPVFHLHGIRTNPEEIIIAQEDYVTLFRPTEYRQIKLALTIKESTTLFLGYGLGDVNVLTAIDWSKNVFRGEPENYPNDVVQVFRTENPSELPYRDRNGIVIIETAELADFFTQFGEARNALAQKQEKEQAVLKDLAAKLNSPDTSIIDLFIDDAGYRANTLKMLSQFSIYLISGFVSFLDKCIDETWKRSAPTGAFEGYNQNLTIILDILTAFPLERFPPALFQKAAYGLERVAYYVGPLLGQSFAAHNTWENRKGTLTKEIVNELRSVAAQYRYWSIQRLLTSIPVH